ncbi:hypothetical protein M3Y94_01266900 [Aphelenchoides besseyi]|nr:hypothetical protein M3Y94_01266900 [Aphelenchoides besseyi]KAI6222596.1 hypothetical protein M3Y95_00910400 [Aphelenchoides besseyi]
MANSLVIFVVLLGICCLTVTGQSYPSANQNVTIKRLTGLLSNYLSYSQWNVLCNTVANDVYLQKDFATVKSDVMNTAMNQLTSSQYSTIMSKATMLILKMGPSKVTGALNTVLTVLGNNLGPFYTQLNTFSKSMQTRGLKPAACWKEQFRLVNSFLTLKRVNTIFTRVSLQFSKSDWQTFSSSLSSFLRFSKYGL